MKQIIHENIDLIKHMNKWKESFPRVNINQEKILNGEKLDFPQQPDFININIEINLFYLIFASAADRLSVIIKRALIKCLTSSGSK